MSYPPTPPVVVFVAGMRVEEYTTLKLRRVKKDMTGNLTLTLFGGSVPSRVIAPQVRAGAPIHVYIGGHLAFTGKVDRRGASGAKGKGGKGGNASDAGGAGVSTHISADRYEITITARGKTRRIVDSSHVFKGGTTLGAITRPVVERITRPFGVVLDWRAPVHDMDRSVLRDGGNAKDEVHRVCNEYGYYCWETRDGKLRVADQAGPETGEPIILGDNVLVFGTSQGDDNLNSDISVQGQRTKKGIRGKAAVNRSKRIKMPFVEDFAPLRLQHYTDATDEALQRRAEFEANNRLSDSFTVQVEVFHVQARDGSPWDIGTLHYVEIPCEGIFDVMECTALEYEVDAERNLKTRLTLSPPPGGAGGGAGGAVTAAAGLASIGGLASLAGAVGTQAAAIASIDISAARMALHGFKRVAGQYPLAWGVPTLVDAIDGADDAIGAASGLLTLAAGAFDEVPLLLPPSFKGT